MREFFQTHNIAKWFAIILAGLVSVIVLFLLLFDWNMLRPAVAKYITAKTGRGASIEGNLTVHPWSWNPSAEVEGLALENPSWAERKLMFRAERLSLTLSLGSLLRGELLLPRVLVVHPSIDLQRDAAGRASWQFGSGAGAPKENAPPAKLPPIRRLIIEHGSVRIDDKIRKLTLSGSLEAHERSGAAAAFRLECAKNKDCAAMLAQATAQQYPSPAAAVPQQP